MIHVENLKKAYGENQALRGIDFEVQSGEIVGLLGPNGAGKTTTIKILTGYLHPDEGVVKIDGLDVLQDSRAVQARIGYLPENTPLYPDLSVQAYLKLMANMRGLPVSEQPALISEAIVATGLEKHRARPIGQLSKGLRQRVGLAQAILHKPKLLILDEPTVGLDPTQIVEIRHLIQRLAKHSTILFSSHILSEVQAVCDRVIIVINGQIRTDARLADLEASSDAILVLEREIKGVEKAISALAGVTGIEQFVTPEGYSAYRVLGQRGVDLCPQIYQLAHTNEWPLRELRREVVTLESIFNELAAAPEPVMEAGDDSDNDEDDAVVEEEAALNY